MKTARRSKQPGCKMLSPHQNAVREAGGTLIYADLPTREEWAHVVARYAGYAPGCGQLTHVVGTNAGQMPCGANLTHLDGKTAPYFCGACEEKFEKSRHGT